MLTLSVLWLFQMSRLPFSVLWLFQMSRLPFSVLWLFQMSRLPFSVLWLFQMSRLPFSVLWLFQMSRLPKADGIEMVAMLARCLPHIVPHVLLGKREVRHPFSHCPSCFAGQARGTSSFLTSSLMFCWASERYVILSHIVPHVLLGKREVRHPFSHRPSCFAGQARGTSSFLTSSLMFCWASERYVILSHIVPHVLLGKREVRHPFSHRPSCFAGQARGTSSFLTSSLMFCWASERYVILSHIVPHVLLGKREVRHPFSHRPSCFAGQARGTSSFLTSSLMFCWANERYIILPHILFSWGQ